jgi:hypothetical protein
MITALLLFYYSHLTLIHLAALAEAHIDEPEVDEQVVIDDWCLRDSWVRCLSLAEPLLLLITRLTTA